MLWTPYFTWKISHHLHHIHHATMDGDDAYVPRTRSELSLPERIRHFDYEEYLGDTPIYTLTTLVLRQFFAYPIYLGAPYRRAAGAPRADIVLPQRFTIQGTSCIGNGRTTGKVGTKPCTTMTSH